MRIRDRDDSRGNRDPSGITEDHSIACSGYSSRRRGPGSCRASFGDRQTEILRVNRQGTAASLPETNAGWLGKGNYRLPAQPGDSHHGCSVGKQSCHYPVEANYLAMSGLRQMVDTVESVGNDHPGIAIRAVIPCRAHPRRRVHQAIMEQFEQLFPQKVSPIVRENAALAEAPGRGRPVILSAPKSHGAEDYRQVALWLSEHIA